MAGFSRRDRGLKIPPSTFGTRRLAYLLVRLNGHTSWVCKLAFSREGRRLISAAADHSIRIWDTGTWTLAKVLRGHRDEVHAVAISETGHLIASASKDGDLMLWNDEGNKANDGYVRLPDDLLSVMPLDRSRVMLLRSDSPPELFDLSRNASLGLMPGLGPSTNLFGFGGKVHSRGYGTNAVGFFPHRSTEANWFCHWDGTNQLLVDEWNGSQFMRRGAVLLNGGRRPTGAEFNPARQLVAWNEPTASNSVFLASLTTRGRRMELKSEIPGLFPYRFSDDGKYLATTSPEINVWRIWNVDTGQSVLTFSGEISEMVFAVGGRVLAAACRLARDHEIRFYDLDHPDREPRCVPGKHSSQKLVVSPDGRLVAATSDGGMVRLCDAVTGQLIKDLPRPSECDRWCRLR